MRSQLECYVQVWAPQYKKEKELVKKGAAEAVKMMRGLEHLSYKERLQELGLVGLDMSERGSH